MGSFMMKFDALTIPKTILKAMLELIFHPKSRIIPTVKIQVTVEEVTLPDVMRVLRMLIIRSEALKHVPSRCKSYTTPKSLTHGYETVTCRWRRCYRMMQR